jgi:glucokinase
MENKPVVVGIDIGGTNTVFGYVDRNGQVLTEGKIKTTDYGKPELFVEALFERIMSAKLKIGLDVDIIGFGIGAPMGNINKGTIEHPAGLPWKGIIPLADIFKKHTDLPVIVTNDANAAAVGEMIYGAARGMKNFVVITLGTGLGSGFVVDGKLVYGHNGFAGEIGHTSVGRQDDSTRECGCGKRGCLETYVSATGIKRTVLNILGDSLLPSELRKYRIDELDSKTIYDAAKNGDIIANRAFDFTGKILGFKLADVVAHTDPEAIFLFGGLAQAKEFIFTPAIESMETNLLSIYREKVKILPSGLSEQNAAVMGASSLIWSDKEQ